MPKRVDEALIRRAVGDPDVQVRRLAMRAASGPGIGATDVAAGVLRQGLADVSPMVRLEALRSVKKASAIRSGVDGVKRTQKSA